MTRRRASPAPSTEEVARASAFLNTSLEACRGARLDPAAVVAALGLIVSRRARRLGAAQGLAPEQVARWLADLLRVELVDDGEREEAGLDSVPPWPAPPTRGPIAVDLATLGFGPGDLERVLGLPPPRG